MARRREIQSCRRRERTFGLELLNRDDFFMSGIMHKAMKIPVKLTLDAYHRCLPIREGKDMPPARRKVVRYFTSTMVHYLVHSLAQMRLHASNVLSQRGQDSILSILFKYNEGGQA